MDINKIPLIQLNPLRYPGGKRWLAPYIDRIIEANALRPNLFVEPFAGGSAISLHLLHSNKVEAIGLADKDPLIAALWKTVFFDTDWLLNQVENAEVSLDEWHYWKNVECDSVRDRAFQCLFLNRTSFSGILEQAAGPIGGLQQKSEYKIDCRFNKNKLLKAIQYLGENYKDRVLFIWNKSWKYTIGELSRRIDINDDYDANKLLVYLDPPFIMQGQALYRHAFKDVDHADLRDSLAECELPWILSYDDCELSRQLYRGLPRSTLDVLYSVSNRKGSSKTKSELIVSNLQNTISGILPANQKKHRVAVNSGRGIKIREQEDRLCQSRMKVSLTGTR